LFLGLEAMVKIAAKGLGTKKTAAQNPYKETTNCRAVGGAQVRGKKKTNGKGFLGVKSEVPQTIFYVGKERGEEGHNKEPRKG